MLPEKRQEKHLPSPPADPYSTHTQELELRVAPKPKKLQNADLGKDDNWKEGTHTLHEAPSTVEVSDS